MLYLYLNTSRLNFLGHTIFEPDVVYFLTIILTFDGSQFQVISLIALNEHETAIDFLYWQVYCYCWIMLNLELYFDFFLQDSRRPIFFGFADFANFDLLG